MQIIDLGTQYTYKKKNYRYNLNKHVPCISISNFQPGVCGYADTRGEEYVEHGKTHTKSAAANGAHGSRAAAWACGADGVTRNISGSHYSHLSSRDPQINGRGA
jgi:hypothetical protein